MVDTSDFEQPWRGKSTAPKGWEPSLDWRGDGGTITTTALEHEPDDAIWQELIKDWGLDPKTVRIIPGSVQVRAWDAAIGKGLVKRMRYYRARLEPLIPAADHADVEALIKAVMRRKAVKETFVAGSERAVVVNLSDWQTGKVNRGRGTPELVEALNRTFDDLVAWLKTLRKLGIEAVYVIGLGDLVEQCDGHYCVHADTPILTDDLRWVPAGSLEVGDGLYSFTEDAVGPRGRRYAKAQVLANKVEMLESVKVTFSDGQTLTCTPEHPLLSTGPGPHPRKSGWTSAGDLVPGDRVAKLADPWERGDTFDHGWLGGLYDGEGCLSAGRERSGPNILQVSQLPGPVLDRAKALISEFGFEASETTNASSGVSSLRIRGGYPEILRMLGTVRPERLISKVGEPMMQSDWVEIVSVESVGLQPIARLGTSTHTYFANGYASHNSMQAFTVDLDRREQMRLVRRLILELVDRIVALGLRVVLGAVPGNHGENRRNGKAFTTWTDNDDLAVFDGVAEVCVSNRDRYSLVSVPQGAIADDLTLTLDVAGVPIAWAHGHQCKNGGPEKWWAGQVMGYQKVASAHILNTGHFHHLTISEKTGRTWMQMPAMDGGSEWWTSQTGQISPRGTVAYVAGNSCGPRGWSDLVIL